MICIKNGFNELLEQFLSELITHDSFIYELDNYNQRHVEVIGIDTYYYWLSIPSDYIALKKFNQNEGQLSLF